MNAVINVDLFELCDLNRNYIDHWCECYKKSHHLMEDYFCSLIFKNCDNDVIVLPSGIWSYFYCIAYIDYLNLILALFGATTDW